MRSQGRIAGFDGIRALAVAGVVACHISPRVVGSGGLGVTVFFVLSGYLITSLLLGEQARNGRIALMAFYARRALRLYPALILMLLLCAPWAALFGNHGMADGYVLTVVVAVTYMSDIAMIITGTTLGSFPHTWSLAVEEHFYLIWPAVLAMTLRRRRDPIWLATAAAVTSYVLLIATAGADQGSWSYRLNFAPHTRAYDLMAGCILALWLSRRGPLPSRMSSILAIIGLAGLVGLVITMSMGHHHVWRAAAIAGATLSSSMLVGGVLCGQDSTLVRLLEQPVFARMGQISYGVYLFHLPVLGLAKHYLGADSQALLYATVIPITVLLAQASFRWVEGPVAARGRARLTRRSRASLPAPAGGVNRQVLRREGLAG
jgi:peptidoglycan/LPS O-acetylase OafA/YrhL